MKRIYNMYKKLALAVTIAFAALMTSCTDYLTIIPPDKIVHEKFWQTKDEVNGMLATSYLKLLSTDAVSKAIIWGELRADNLTFPANYNEDIKHIVEANILDDNGYAGWGVYYEAINYANLVIEYAHLVEERDPDFEIGDLNVVLGEMYAMRALCHFYLVRTFRDIPMALVPAVNDAELPDYKQVHPLEALNFIMKDLDTAENLVKSSEENITPAQYYGRITKNAVLAIKADVNLWRAAFATYYEGNSDLVADGDVQRYYTECIEDCRMILDNMKAAYLKKHPNGIKDEMGEYLLIPNEGEYSDKNKTHKSTSYDEIFGAMNSMESIFELQVEGSNRDNGFCAGVYSVYGTEGNVGRVIVPKSFVNIYEKDDLRRFIYVNVPEDDKKDITVGKYSLRSSPVTPEGYRKSNDYDANWIVYRKTDVMLMMAEALAAQPLAGVDDFKEAFKLANAINNRSRIDVTKNLNEAEYLDRNSSLQLVLDERTRELTFEGKRWYDLVRKALREKTTANITFVADKLDSNQEMVKSKMSSIDGLFFPIHIDELRFNKSLKQNPAYSNNDSSTEMIK